MDAHKLEALTGRLLKLERMIDICNKVGGPIKVSYDKWDGDEWLEDCLVNTVKVEIKRICEHEVEIVTRQIKDEVLI